MGDSKAESIAKIMAYHTELTNLLERLSKLSFMEGVVYGMKYAEMYGASEPDPDLVNLVWEISETKKKLKAVMLKIGDQRDEAIAKVKGDHSANETNNTPSSSPWGG